MRTGQFKLLIHIVLELQQHFVLASNLQRHVDDEIFLPLPSDYIKPVQGFI